VCGRVLISSTGQKRQAYLEQYILADHCCQPNILKTSRSCNDFIVQMSFRHCRRDVNSVYDLMTLRPNVYALPFHLSYNLNTQSLDRHPIFDLNAIH
jgi:hypothetical protein